MGDNKGASDVDGQVWDAFDPDRTMREAMAVASTSEEAPEWLTAIAADAAPAWEALRAATGGRRNFTATPWMPSQSWWTGVGQ